MNKPKRSVREIVDNIVKQNEAMWEAVRLPESASEAEKLAVLDRWVPSRYGPRLPMGAVIGAAEYERRVRIREAEGLTRSDAQGVVDAELLSDGSTVDWRQP